MEYFATEAARVGLLDHVLVARESDRRIELTSVQPPMATDEDGVVLKRREGILRWDMEAPAKAVGRPGASVEYEFLLEYDRGMTQSATSFETAALPRVGG